MSRLCLPLLSTLLLRLLHSLIGFCSEFFSRCRDCARRRRYFLVVEQESTQRNRPCCSRPSADAPGNLPQSTDPARRGTPAALKRSGQTAAASQWLKLLRHLTQQPPDRLPEAGVIRRDWVRASTLRSFLGFIESRTSEFTTPENSATPLSAPFPSAHACITPVTRWLLRQVTQQLRHLTRCDCLTRARSASGVSQRTA